MTALLYHEVDFSRTKSKLPDLPTFTRSQLEDGFPEDEDIEHPEAEPGMLLQPHIIPISHEQFQRSRASMPV